MENIMRSQIIHIDTPDKKGYKPPSLCHVFQDKQDQKDCIQPEKQPALMGLWEQEIRKIHIQEIITNCKFNLRVTQSTKSHNAFVIASHHKPQSHAISAKVVSSTFEDSAWQKMSQT